MSTVGRSKIRRKKIVSSPEQMEQPTGDFPKKRTQIHTQGPHPIVVRLPQSHTICPVVLAPKRFFLSYEKQNGKNFSILKYEKKFHLQIYLEFYISLIKNKFWAAS